MSRHLMSIDIIIPVYFAPECLVRCIESVIDTTSHLDLDIKILVVDDSMSKQFSELISSLLIEKRIANKVILINREKNGGFIEACYTGIEYRESDYKVLLNSDTVVMGKWLENMIETAQSDEKIAMVNPLSNNAPPITVEMPRGFNINLMKNFIEDFVVESRDYIEIVTIVGFCFLIKSKYIKKFGFFDRIYDKGYGEESDLHFRYIREGLRCVISPNSFVYHRSEASFSDRDERLLRNRKIFFSRYKGDYERDFPKFHENTIVNRINEEILLVDELKFDVLILLEDNNLFRNEVYFAHKLTNNLNELGYSATLVLKNNYTRVDRLKDTLYSAIEIENLLLRKYDVKYVITEENLILDGIRLCFTSEKKSQLFLLNEYIKNHSKSKGDFGIEDKLKIRRVSSILDDANSNIVVPLKGSFDFLPFALKDSEKVNNIIIFSDENELLKGGVDSLNNEENNNLYREHCKMQKYVIF